VFAVLFKAGDHVPVTPLFDVVGNGLNAAPLQTGLIALKVGTVGALKQQVLPEIPPIVINCRPGSEQAALELKQFDKPPEEHVFGEGGEDATSTTAPELYVIVITVGEPAMVKFTAPFTPLQTVFPTTVTVEVPELLIVCSDGCTAVAETVPLFVFTVTLSAQAPLQPSE
jgi:hypothetical protein